MANAEFMSAPCTKTAENKIRSATHNTDNTTGDTSRIHKHVGSLLGYSPSAILAKEAKILKQSGDSKSRHTGKVMDPSSLNNKTDIDHTLVSDGNNSGFTEKNPCIPAGTTEEPFEMLHKNRGGYIQPVPLLH